MGFVKNMMDEAGKKTGKAIGNKLFGKNAADITINSNVNSSDGGGEMSTKGMINKVMATAMTSALLSSDEDDREIKKDNRRRGNQQYDELYRVEFDMQDVATNVKILAQLLPLIDSWVKEMIALDEDDDEYGRKENITKLYNIARSKFDTGVVIVQSLDITSPYVQLFQNKQKEWDDAFAAKENKKKRSKQKFTLSIVIYVILFIMFFLFVGLLSDC